MAITATIAVSSATVVTEQKVTARVTISNSGAYPVNVTEVIPLVRLTGSTAPDYGTGVALGKVDTGPNTNLVIQPSGSLVLTYGIRFHGPSTASASNLYDGSGSNTFDVGATVYTDDGSVTSPTATTITVNYAVDY